MNILIALLAGAAMLPQDAPHEIPKKDLPKEAKCLVCVGEGEEKPAGGYMYKGTAYYFCNTTELKNFKKDPEAYIPPVLPRAVPELKATTLEGQQVTLADYKEKVVLLDFWATWCAPCVKSMPAVDKLFGKFKDQGFVVLGLSIDQDPKKVPGFLKKNSVSYPVLLDDTKQPTWAAFKVTAVPAMYLIKNGQIIAQWRGEAEMKDVEAEVEKALKG